MTQIINGAEVGTTVLTQAVASTAAIGSVITPTFSVSDSITRPANANAYSAGKSINCSLTVTAVSRVVATKTITLTCNGHPLAVNDRITVAGVDSGCTWTNTDGNWVVSAKDANTFTFVVTGVPGGAGADSQNGLSITGAIAKCMSFDVASVNGGGVIVSRISVALPGIAMTGAVRAWLYTAQTTVLVDQGTFTLLLANDTYRRDYIDLYPVTEAAGSEVTFASARLWEVYKTAASDTRLYMRLVAEGAGTPTSAGVVTVRMSGVQLLG